MKASIYLALVAVSHVAAAETLEHPIHVSSSNSSTVVTEVNARASFKFDQIVSDLFISAVTKNNDKYVVAIHCQSTKFDSEENVTGLTINELEIVTMSSSEHVLVDCGFGKLLQLSLANKSLKRDS